MKNNDYVLSEEKYYSGSSREMERQLQMWLQRILWLTDQLKHWI